MHHGYRNRILTLTLLAILFALASAAFASLADEARFSEEQGIDIAGTGQAIPEPGLNPQGKILLDSLPNADVLLIPDSRADNIGMYDPQTGAYLGIFANGQGLFTTPICATPGPDGNIYVSDQVADAVFVYDRGGTYLYTYADGSDGLNNIRGIAFRGDHLFVTSGDDYVAEFSGPHVRLPDFINDGSDSFDILFLDDGRALLSNIGTTNNVRLYDATGVLIQPLFNISFPEQLQADPSMPGDYLNASFTGDRVTDFDLDGSIAQTTTWDNGRGCYRLGNGNLLLTSASGVYEVEPGSGSIIEQKSTIDGRFVELCRPVPSGIEQGALELPKNFSLVQNYPNPFNARTIIGYNLREEAYVIIDIYDLLGTKVESLVSKKQPAGSYQVIWNADDFPTGIYFSKIQVGGHSETKKMVLLK